jgi:hypothetical protein
LDRASGPVTADRIFYHNQLHSVFNGDASDDAGTYNFTAPTTGIFNGDSAGTFDNGTHGTYNVAFPDVLTPTNGSVAALNYSGGLGGAAGIQYDGSLGGGKVVYWGFPFETIIDPATRDAYMSDILNFFSLIPAPQVLKTTLTNNTITLTWSASAGLKYRVQYKNTLTDPSWITLSPDVNATATTASKVDTLAGTNRFYRIILLN